MIKHIKASNLLSFGPDGLDLEMRNLNVLIGPNGSGKSNFLDLLDLLRVLPSDDVQGPIRRGGGITEWIWKGADSNSTSQVEVLIDYPIAPKLLKHTLKIANFQEQLYLADERIADDGAVGQSDGVYFYYLNVVGTPFINFMSHSGSRTSTSQGIQPGVSILSQRQDPEAYPELYHIAMTYKQVRLYREWSFGRNSNIRRSQAPDLRNDGLEMDFSNLGLVLSRLRKLPATKRALIAALQALYEGITDFEVIIAGGTVQIFLYEGDFLIPAVRLSDGTLRYLCLIALLLDPKPPLLICIEEPELGLHPDIIPKIADLLVDASSRTQLVVTTHSDMLIDALSEQPESILVCEKEEGQTYIKRLKQADLNHWLKDYRLGDLWLSGEIGGKRW